MVMFIIKNKQFPLLNENEWLFWGDQNGDMGVDDQ